MSIILAIFPPISINYDPLQFMNSTMDATPYPPLLDSPAPTIEMGEHWDRESSEFHKSGILSSK